MKVLPEGAQRRAPDRAAAWLAMMLTIPVNTLAADSHERTAALPWMNSTLSPDERAQLVVGQMTLDEKISLVHGSYGYRPPHRPEMPLPAADSAGGDGYIPGIARLGIPPLQLIGAGMGVTDIGARSNGQATAFPAGLALAATWDRELAHELGSALGRELRSKGFNVHLGGGANVVREALGGRNFEY